MEDMDTCTHLRSHMAFFCIICQKIVKKYGTRLYLLMRGRNNMRNNVVQKFMIGKIMHHTHNPKIVVF